MTMKFLFLLLLAVFFPCSIPQNIPQIVQQFVPDQFFPRDLAKRLGVFKDSISGTPALIKKHGYPVESHTTKTKDGYLLTMQRIPHGLKGPKKNSRMPIIILPGLACSANTYVGLNDSIAYYLADKGFDVWLGNHRGSIRYSRHVKYRITSNKFWDFSWEEMGEIDIPAKIDHILKETGRKQVVILSFSMSSAATLALLSNTADYNTKVARHIALGPVATGHYQTSVVMTLVARFYKTLMFVYTYSVNKGIANWIGFFGLSYLAPAFCLTIGERICMTFFNFFLGYSPEAFGHRISMTVSDVTGGTSFKCLVHLLQQIKFPDMRRFDYGRTKNLKRYGKVSPPAYNFSKITVPNTFIYGANDPGGNGFNVELVAREMPDCKTVLMKDRMFNHASFVWSIDRELKEDINEQLLEHARMTST